MTVNQNWEFSWPFFSLAAQRKQCVQAPTDADLFDICCIRLQTVLLDFSKMFLFKNIYESLNPYRQYWLLQGSLFLWFISYAGKDLSIHHTSQRWEISAEFGFLLSIYLSISLSHSVSLHSRSLSLACKAQTDAVSCRCVGVWSPERPDIIPACCVITPRWGRPPDDMDRYSTAMKWPID